MVPKVSGIALLKVAERSRGDIEGVTKRSNGCKNLQNNGLIRSSFVCEINSCSEFPLESGL